MSNLQLKATVGVAGRYRLRVGKPGQKPRVDTGWFDNLITDAGLNAMGSDGYMNACQVGNGNTAPVNGNTAMESFLAGTTTKNSNTVSAESSSPWYGARTVTYRFAAGEAEGNVSEVGIATAATGGTLFSRALVVDGETPVTITVLPDEFLDVTYQLQWVPPTSDVVTTVVDSGPAGTSHTVRLRACEVDTVDTGGTQGWTGNATSTTSGAVELSTSPLANRAYNGSIGAIDESPAGSADNSASATNDAYVDTSLEKTGSITFGLNDANFDITAIKFYFRNGGTWQAGFSPAIPKDNTKTLTIGVSVSWTRTTAL
jgi:hypothetical protein